MRISDWSSDVCSSDLVPCGTAWPHAPPPNASNVQRALPQMTALHPDTMNTSLQTVAPPAPDASLRMLKHGTRLLEPDVYVARVGARQAVFKDYRRYKWPPLAPLARLLVRHEARVLDTTEERRVGKGWVRTGSSCGSP